MPNNPYEQMAADEAARPAAALTPDATPVAPTNPYDDMAKQEVQDKAAALKLSLYKAPDTNPDVAAKTYDLAKTTGLPNQVVANNQDDIAKQVSATDSTKLQAESPRTADWIAQDQLHGAVAQNSIPAMQNMEQIVKDADFYKNVGDAVMANSIAPIVRGVGLIPSFINRMSQANPDAALPSDYESALKSSLADNAVVRQGVDMKKQFTDATLTRDLAADIGNTWKTDPGLATRQFIEKFGAPLVGQGLLMMGGPAGIMLGAAAQGAGATEDSAQEGKTDNQALIAGLGQTGTFLATSALGEVLQPWAEGLSQSLGKRLGLNVGQSLLASAMKKGAGALSGSATMMAMEEGNRLSAYYGGDENAFHDNIKGLWGAALTGAILHIPHLFSADAPHELVDDANKADVNKNMMMGLADKYGKSDISKTKAGPDYLDHLLQGQAQLIHPSDFGLLFQGDKDGALGAADKLGVTDAYLKAKESGTEFAIPTAKIISEYHNAPTFEEFCNHLKSEDNPEGSTPAQVAEAIKLAKTQLPDKEAEAKITSIGDTIRSKMIEGGAVKSHADAIAKVWEEFYRTISKKAGIDPLEHFNENFGSVTNELPKPGEAGPKPGTPEYDEMINEASEAARIQLTTGALKDSKGLTPTIDALVKFGGLDLEEIKALGLTREFTDLEHNRIFPRKGGKKLDRATEHLAEIDAISQNDRNELFGKIKKELFDLNELTQKLGTKRGTAFNNFLKQGSNPSESLDTSEDKGDNKSRSIPDSDELTYLKEKLAKEMGSHAETTRALGEEKRLRRTDQKTGLPNKIAADEDIARDKPKRIAAFDFDNFKGYNNALGHEGVDKTVLPKVGEVLLKAANDLGVKIFHRSGDEFQAHFHEGEGDHQDAEAKMQQVMDRLADLKFIAKGMDDVTHLPVTYEVDGVPFTHGIGEDYDNADASATKRSADLRASGVKEDVRASGGVPRNFHRLEPSTEADGRTDNGLQLGGQGQDLGNPKIVLDHDAPLEQKPNGKPGAEDARGGFFTDNEGKFHIYLGPKADASTLAHESSHAFTHILKSLAESADATDDIKADYKAMQKAAGYDESKGWTRANLEKIATHFEQYMKDGKAPSAELQPVFNRFRNWMVGVYRRFMVTGQPVSPDLKAVFDRWLASDNAADAAQAAQGREPFPGLDKPSYLKHLQEARDYITNRTDEKLIDQYNKQRSEEWAKERQGIADKNLAIVKESKAYQSLDMLQKGVDAEGKPLEKPIKIDGSDLDKSQTKGLPKDIFANDGSPADLVADQLGYDSTDAMLRDLRDRVPAEKVAMDAAQKEMLAKHGDLLNDGSLPTEALDAAHNEPHAKSLRDEWDYIAEHHPASARAISKDLSRATDASDAMKSAAVFKVGGDVEANPRLFAREADKMRNAAASALAAGDVKGAAEYHQLEAENRELQKVAQEAKDKDSKEVVTSKIEALKEKYRDLIRAKDDEIKAIKENDKKTGQATKGMMKRALPPDAVKSAAAFMVGDMKIGEIKPADHLRAENKMRNQAANLFTKGDFEGAMDAKQKEILNHELWKQTTAAKADFARIAKYMGKFDKDAASKRMGKAGIDFLRSVQYIRGENGFTDPSSKEGAEALDRLMDRLQDQGKPLMIMPSVTDGTKPTRTKNTPYSDMRDAYDAVKQIEHAASIVNKIMSEQKALDKDTLRDTVKEFSETHFSDKFADKGADNNPHLSGGAKLAEGTRRLLSTNHSPMAIFIAADADKGDGPWFSNFWKPKERAQNDQLQMEDEHRERVTKILDSRYSTKEKYELGIKQYDVEGMTHRPTKNEMMAAIANYGNDGNREIMKNKNMYDDATIQKFAKHMEPRDLDTINDMHAAFDSYKPKIQEQKAALNGKELKWVKPSPFQLTLADGSVRDMPGGYWPIVPDTKRSDYEPRKTDVKDLDSLIGDNFAWGLTDDGYSKDRTKNSGRALSMDLNVFDHAIKNMIHDLAYRGTLIDLKGNLEDPGIRSALIRSVGPEKYAQLKPWIERLATGVDYDPSGAEPYAKMFRNNYTLAHIAVNVAVPIKHASMEFPAMRELGARDWLGGLATMSNPFTFAKNIDMIESISPYMAHTHDAGDSNLWDIASREKMIPTPGMISGALEGIKDGSGSKAALFDMYKAHAAQAGLALLRCMDKFTRAATWMGAYQKSMNGRVPEIAMGDQANAIFYADRVAKEIKGSGDQADVAKILTGTEKERLFTMFMSMRNVIFNQQAKAFRQTARTFSEEGVIKGAMAATSALLFTTVLPNAWIYATTKGIPDRRDRNKALAEMGASSLDGFAFGPDIAKYAIAQAEGKGWSNNLQLPYLDSAMTAMKAGVGGYKMLSGRESHGEARQTKADLEETAGTAFAVPTEGVFKALDGLMNHKGEPIPLKAWHSTFGPRDRKE